jgi:hypothetical protein
VENHSATDTLFVAAILETRSSSTAAATGDGFWKIGPGASATLASDDATVTRAWLRVVVKNQATSRELLPINTEYLDLNGSRDCRWTTAVPSTFLCVAQRRFSPAGASLSVSFGTHEQNNNLRAALEKQGRFKLFKFDRNSNREHVYIWK